MFDNTNNYGQFSFQVCQQKVQPKCTCIGTCRREPRVIWILPTRSVGQWQVSLDRTFMIRARWMTCERHAAPAVTSITRPGRC